MKKGQSILEYSVVIAVIVAALLSMQSYIKRSLQGAYRGTSQIIGEAYEPRNTSSDYTLSTLSTTLTVSTSNQAVVSGENKIITDTQTDTVDSMSQTGWEQVGPL